MGGIGGIDGIGGFFFIGCCRYIKHIRGYNQIHCQLDGRPTQHTLGLVLGHQSVGTAAAAHMVARLKLCQSGGVGADDAAISNRRHMSQYNEECCMAVWHSVIWMGVRQLLRLNMLPYGYGYGDN